MENVVAICEEISEEERASLLKKPFRRTSEMWKFFTPLDNCYALCTLCDLKFSYRTSTSNLRKHIVCKHPGSNLVDSSKCSDENLSPSSPPSPKNTPVTIKDTTKRMKNKTDRSLFTEMNHKPVRKHSYYSDQKEESDVFDAYGFTVASKLRKLDEKQMLYCEKIINDALFKAALKQLNPLSEIVVPIITNPSSAD